MRKPKVAGLVNGVRTFTVKHTPEILVGIGITGMITTTVLAVGATPKALILIDEKKKEEGVDELSPLEVAKTTWKCYVPAAVTGTLSVACMIGGSSVSARRNAALATAYKLSETALTEYREKVIDTIGERKERDIRDKVDKSRVEKNPVSKSEVFITEKGNTLCLDYYSGRYFKSDIEQIKKAVNELNRTMLVDMYVSLNEFYDELGLDHTSIGDQVGWKVDDGLIELDFSSQIADDGTPCIVLNYRVAPKHDFSRLS